MNTANQQQYTDQQLQLTLARMLPEKIEWSKTWAAMQWLDGHPRDVRDTEWLHVCWLVEDNLEPIQAITFGELLFEQIPDDADDTAGQARFHRWHATWQQRAIALAKVKGVEIV